ncbi:hypothetical protein, partial [Streptomyces sp. NPDC057580]|uniref:hypothetical protein n=1 Tax=Streptomyces sp. NPDC057580 TaxID=3346173 RepID=UPI0036AEB02E
MEVEAVFDRHAAADLSAAYAALVPQRRSRIRDRLEQAGVSDDHQCGDLRPGVLGPAEEGPDDRLADRG